MKHILTITTVAVVLAASATSSHATLNFAGINNAQFNAVGTTFQLNPTGGSIATPQFNFTGADTGLTGWITGAPWTVNMAGLVSTTVGGNTYQQAPVIGGGQLNIYDGIKTLTGNLSWLTIQTSSLGQGGTANSLSLNLSSLAYTGLNADLLALVTTGTTGNLNLTYQFSGIAPQLSSIYSGTGVTTASYSGSISSAASIAQSVPEPSTVVAGALLLLPFGISSMRILRKHKQATA